MAEPEQYGWRLVAAEDAGSETIGWVETFVSFVVGHGIEFQSLPPRDFYGVVALRAFSERRFGWAVNLQASPLTWQLLFGRRCC